eukprot:1569684-Rhodomonas_salina.1
MEVLHPHDGAMLFQVRAAGINGVRNTAYRLLHDPNEPGSHSVEHVAQLFSPVTKQQLEETGGTQMGDDNMVLRAVKRLCLSDALDMMALSWDASND